MINRYAVKLLLDLNHIDDIVRAIGEDNSHPYCIGKLGNGWEGSDVWYFINERGANESNIKIVSGYFRDREDALVKLINIIEDSFDIMEG